MINLILHRQRKRMIDLKIALLDLIDKEASEKMTTSEVVSVLLEVSERLIGNELRDEAQEESEKAQ